MRQWGEGHNKEKGLQEILHSLHMVNNSLGSHLGDHE